MKSKHPRRQGLTMHQARLVVAGLKERLEGNELNIAMCQRWVEMLPYYERIAKFRRRRSGK